MLILWKIQGWMNPQKGCEIAQILYILIFNMEPIKLQCNSTVELKDAIGASQMKNKLELFCF